MSIATYGRLALQEVCELGLTRTAARLLWEFKVRSGYLRLRGLPHACAAELPEPPFTPPDAIRKAMAGRVGQDALAALGETARSAVHGRILCFGRWEAEFGDPPDWHLHPASRRRWNSGVHWSRVMRDAYSIGDVKLTWEIGRFPHAWHMARAATFIPELAPALSVALSSQIASFRECNPFGMGVHWLSSQEVAIRLWSWLFATSVFRRLGQDVPDLTPDLHAAAVHVSRHLEYARHAVYNNHLLSEALCLYLAGRLLRREEWLNQGRALLDEQATAQVYPDGGYIQNSHTYHRFAMQLYLLANAFEPGRAGWRSAMERSLDFLYAHQNPSDGKLPNYGANDGALPLVLSTCDYTDFRPTLQALSLATRGERLYEPGPWDEEAAWLLGPRALNLPLRTRARASVSFPHSGYHVLRARNSFASFRCGSLLDRFSQIDMLHVDVWWRGHNVLVDGGSYLYNGPVAWHNHFFRTASHNTLTIDDADQMLHRRQFKFLYWTRARLTRFDEMIAEGEHYGYRRQSNCTHRRSLAALSEDLWVVADTVTGIGTHDLRLHWLCGPYAYDFDGSNVTLSTPDGPFTISIPGYVPSVVSGAEDPPRGWLSRYYGEKVPVASIAVEVRTALPVTLVTVLCPGVPEIYRSGDLWEVNGTQFRITEGSMTLT